jgi:hypothetical protein
MGSRWLVGAVVCCCVVVALVARAADAKLAMEEEAVAVPTEDQVKKMKVRELQSFLSDRGVPCEQCSEKSDFVKKALANREAPLLASKRKLKPKGEFWEHWSGLARSMCEEGAAKKGAASELCGEIAPAVDSFFMQHSKRTASKLKKGTAALLKTSVAEPYQGAGRRLLSKLISHCLKNTAACASQTKVLELIDGNKIKNVDFSKWITNVGIENTNPMYEALKDKTLNADL